MMARLCQQSTFLNSTGHVIWLTGMLFRRFAGYIKVRAHMRKVAPLSLLLVFALIAGCERPTAKPVSSAPSGAVQIEQSEFGLFKIDDEKKATFSPSKTVPLSVNQAYGWVVKLRTKQDKVKWREEFTLPAAPAIWDNPPASLRELSADRKTSTLEKEVSPNNGTIFNAWSVAPGDPTGRYTIRLTIEDAEPIVFEFEVR
jgi:hypothetical protein